MIGSIDDKRPSCNDCVFKYNEMLGCLKPCNMCERFSEYIPIDEETYMEGYWLDDPIVIDQILTEIDTITEKIDILNTILPNVGVEDKCFNAVSYLKGLKKTIAHELLKKTDDPYSPCYGLKEPIMDECPSCGKKVTDPGACPF